MSPILISPQNQRADFERFVSAMSEAMNMSETDFKAQYNISAQTLKLGRPLSNTQGIYDFRPVEGAGAPSQLPQQQINKNDFFIVSNLGLAFGKADFASGSNTYSNSGNYPIFSYPDPAYFAGAPAGAATEAACLQTVVNGTIQLLVSSTPILLPTLVRDYVYNPEGNYVASPLSYPALGPDKIGRGYAELTPNVILDGNTDLSFQVILADGAKTDLDGAISPGTTAATNRNILWLFVNGWIVKNLADGGRNCDLKKV